MTAGLFARGLNPAKRKALEQLAGASGGNWFRDLLDFWVPSGTPSGDDGLRAAVRDGELHFYRQGRRMARVCFDQERQKTVQARMQIHERYTGGDGDSYRKFGDGEEPYPGRERLARWIATPSKAVGVEKVGVDKIVGANPLVVDLEVGIPGPPKGAPRMDIVALEGDQDRPRIVFWEVKTLDDKRLRAKGDVEAEVIRQLRIYRDFVSDAGRKAQVVRAYTEACDTLRWLNDLAGGRKTLPEQVIRGSKGVSLDTQPRVVCFPGANRTPAGWETHKDKIIKAGFKVLPFDSALDVRLA